MSESAKNGGEGGGRRSPAFPYIGLTKAVERAGQLLKKAKRSWALVSDAAQVWGLGAKSSATQQTIGALLAYGLIEDSGSGEGRKAKISDLGWKILEDARPGAKEAALAEAATKPAIVAEMMRLWKDSRPDDAICISELKFEHKFTAEGAEKFLRVYDDTIQFAQFGQDDKVSDKQPEAASKPRDTRLNGTDVTPPIKVKVGDFVQWTNSGMDMFPTPERVTWVSEDGAWLRVESSDTGIPMNEVQPAPPLDAQSPSTGALPPGGTTNQIKVLLDGNRLRITASVDAKGLERLKRILDANAALLEDDGANGLAGR